MDREMEMGGCCRQLVDGVTGYGSTGLDNGDVGFSYVSLHVHTLSNLVDTRGFLSVLKTCNEKNPATKALPAKKTTVRSNSTPKHKQPFVVSPSSKHGQQKKKEKEKEKNLDSPHDPPFSS